MMPDYEHMSVDDLERIYKATGEVAFDLLINKQSVNKIKNLQRLLDTILYTRQLESALERAYHDVQVAKEKVRGDECDPWEYLDQLLG